VIPGSLTLTPLTLAVDLDSQARLIEMLRKQWGVVSTLNRDKQYSRMRVAVSSVGRFREVIEPHLLEQFNYKLP